MTAPRRILVIGLRRIGDLLLATPLIRSLKQAWPKARIEVLLPAGTQGIFEGNPDIDATIVFQRGQGAAALIRRLWRRYQLAVNLQPEDRGHFLALLASARRVSIVPSPGQPGWRWKRWLSSRWVAVDLHQTHAVIQYLQLADALGIARCTELVAPRRAAAGSDGDTLTKPDRPPYAVVHPAPMYRYKAWSESGWAALIAHLVGHGLRVVITGGPDPAERLLAKRLADRSGQAGSIEIVAGQLSLAELSPLLEHAALFVGPDTATTHLAAATGVPMIALFGPSNPCAWGPWPLGCSIHDRSPWQFRGELQRNANVSLLQGDHARRPGCIPCLQEGCEMRRDSPADCLDQLSAARVIAEAEVRLSGHSSAAVDDK
jgi:heptosyltransferase-3